MLQLRPLPDVISFNGSISACEKAAQLEFTLIGVYFELAVGHAAVDTLAQRDELQWRHQRL